MNDTGALDVESLFSLEGRVGLVTGGSRGIGAMIAEGLAAAGAKVYLVARTAADCERTAERLAGYGGGCIPIVGDLSTTTGIDDVARRFEEAEDRLHVLVNNAGVESRAPIDEFTEEQWDRDMDLNLRSVFFTTKRLVPLLRESASEEHRASVINVSSITATKTGILNDYAYRASKAGLNQLTRMLGKDLARDNVNVNAIAPGVFRSGMTDAFLDDENASARFRRINPIPREGHMSEMAGLAIFLASRAANYLTGTIVEIDGGLRFVN